MRVNAERLWQMLMEMAKIGATDKGGNIAKYIKFATL